MVFSDLFFLFVFLPLFLLAYLAAYWLDRRRVAAAGGATAEAPTATGASPLRPAAIRNAVLVAASLVFYAWGEPVYVFLLLVSVLANYLCGLAIDRQATRRRAALIAGLAANLLILGTFKYADFFASTLAAIGIPVPAPHISLPIGISFYTFQSISYLVDVYRGAAPVQRRFGGLLLYISMFPQLIAGPIVRYDLVAREISDRHVGRHDLEEGAYRFLIGLGKKVILANQLGEVADQLLGGDLASLSTAGAWVGIAAYTLQIFFDFSGYSDMAIGLGRCLGFHFPENFRHPYTCTSITDFWRKWHITLGSFFRDYVYIPLGGNRRHQALNILVVWFLTGMWHGASWNFIIWGVYFGLIVTVEKHTLLRVTDPETRRRVIDGVPRPLLHLYSLLLIVVGWGIFYFDDFPRMAEFFSRLVGLTGTLTDIAAESALWSNLFLWLVGIALCLPVYDWLTKSTSPATTNPLSLATTNPSPALPQGEGAVAIGRRRALLVTATRVVVSLALLLLSVALLVGATNNAFIYTRF